MWRGNRRMEWVASTLHTTSEHGVSSITTADAHTSAVSRRLNWRSRRFKWTGPFRRKTKSGFCACAITFQLASTASSDHGVKSGRGVRRKPHVQPVQRLRMSRAIPLLSLYVHSIVAPLNSVGPYPGNKRTILTPWCRALLEKLTGLQLVKKFPAFHRTRRFITALTSVRHPSLSWTRPIQSIYSHPTSWRSILISTHLSLGLPSGLFPSGTQGNYIGYMFQLLINHLQVYCVTRRYAQTGIPSCLHSWNTSFVAKLWRAKHIFQDKWSNFMYLTDVNTICTSHLRDKRFQFYVFPWM